MQTNIVAAATNAVSMVATGSAKTYDITLWVLMPLILIIAAIFISQKMKIKWPTSKWKWSVSWIHGRMLTAVAVWVFLLLTAWHIFPTDWNEFFSKHGWYATLVLIAATVLFLYLFGLRGQAVAGSGREHGAGGNGFKTAIVWILILSVPVMVYGIWSANRTIQGTAEGQVAARSSTGQMAWKINAFPDRFTSVSVGYGEWFTSKVDHPYHRVLVHYDNEPEFPDWKNQELRTRERVGPYTVHFRSATNVAVAVSIVKTRMFF